MGRSSSSRSNDEEDEDYCEQSSLGEFSDNPTIEEDSDDASQYNEKIQAILDNYEEQKRKNTSRY